MSFTLNDIALLLVVLLAGLVLGMMMSGRGKYRRLWQDEKAAHRQTVKDRDARILASDERIRELERERPVATQPVATGAAVTDGPDDLSRIGGISTAQEQALGAAGYHRYDQIAALNAEEEATLEQRLGLKPGTIVQERWREQAAMLDKEGHRGGTGRTATPV